MSAAELHTDVVVLGAGPGGYTAAFRAADLGQDTVLVERYPVLGGVCLNVGCIPSKALLHVARVLTEVAELRDAGLQMPAPALQTSALHAYSRQAVARLTQGLAQLAKQRRIKVLTGYGRFTSATSLELDDSQGQPCRVHFRHAIIATGSHALPLPQQPQHPHILDSTDALCLRELPKRMLVVGGGIIGLEMAAVYHALGTELTLVEMGEQLIPEADADIVRPLHKLISQRYRAIHTGVRVKTMHANDNGTIQVQLAASRGQLETAEYDAVLVAIGRYPNSAGLGLEGIGVQLHANGCIVTDTQQRTSIPDIYAIGDVAGQPMLAHKASHEAKVAAEVIAGLKSDFDNRVIPAVAYTDPELAWVGLTEHQARQQGLDYGTGVFPWAANGRALTLGRAEGITKLLFAKDTDRIIGMAAVGPQAGDLVAEAALAIEMGCVAADLALTIHPHPTLAETVGMAAEMWEGTLTDLYLPKRQN